MIKPERRYGQKDCISSPVFLCGSLICESLNALYKEKYFINKEE